MNISCEPTPMPKEIWRLTTALGVIAVAWLAAVALIDWKRFLIDSLFLLVFVLTMGLGSLFLVALEYVVNATWSVPFRRLSEIMSALAPLSLVLAIPLLLGLHDLYEWTHVEATARDPILLKKSAYLNTPFFLVRFALYYAIWFTGYWLLVRASLRQDRDGDPAYTRRAMKIGPLLMILLVLSITFASFDWIMSLTPHWYSAIFGLYVLVGAIGAGVALTTLAAALLKSRNLLSAGVSRDHFYNLGALLFTLSALWGYVAFAQFLLVWYGKLPHEMAWYELREQGGWFWLSIILVIARFLTPFLALLPRSAKTDLTRLRWVSAWVLGAHALDVYWLVAPSARQEGAPFGWAEPGFLLAAAAAVLLVWLRRTSRSPLAPVGDPRLEAALHFHL